MPIPTAETLPDRRAPSPPPPVTRDETPIPDSIRDRPRPIYKQAAPGSDSSSTLRTHRSGRTRRRVKINQKPQYSPALIAAVIGGAVLLLIVLIVIVWKMTSNSTSVTVPMTNVLSGNSVLVDEKDPFDAIPKSYHMPPGWSMTDKMTAGFELFWPVKSEKAGYTNIEKDLTVRGSPIEFLSYTNKNKRFTWTLEKIKLNEAEKADIESKKKRYIEELKRDGLNKVYASERTLDGQTTLLIQGFKKDMRTTIRMQWTRDYLWAAKVECPDEIPFGDSNVWNFLLSFKPE